MFKKDKTLYEPQESSFPIILKYIDVVRRTHTLRWTHCENVRLMIVGALKVIGCYQGDLTQFTHLNSAPSRGDTWSGERLTKIQATSRPENMWPEIWSGMSKKSQQKENSIGQKRSQSLTMHEG